MERKHLPPNEVNFGNFTPENSRPRFSAKPVGLLLSRKGTAKGKGKGDALKGDARDMSRRELSGTRVGCWRFVGPIFFWGVKGVRLVFMLLFLASFF